MIPILFAPSATTFTTNGVGRLSDALSCIVHEARNGEFELEMTYPVDGAHFSSIVHSAIIVAKPSARRSLQAFRIYKITKPMWGRVTILAQHISYQMSFIPVAPFSALNLTAALAALKANAVESCPFTISSSRTSATSYALSVPRSLRACLGGSQGSILDVYGGGEWEFDNYNVILHSQRGQNSGYTIQYGKNLIDLKQEQNIQNTYTGIYPYYKNEGAMVVLTTDPKVIRAGTASNFPFQRTIEKDFTDQFDTTPTEAALRTKAQAYVNANNIGIPNVSISLDFVNLADTDEYKYLSTGNVDLCDTVTVRFTKLGINVQSKIVDIKYDVLNERYTKLEIGDKRASLSDTIADGIDQMAIMPTTAQMHRAVDMATGTLNKAAGGYVIYNRDDDGHPNETLYLDENSGGNLYNSQHILRINYGGIGFSSNGYQGPYYQSWDLLGHLTLGGVNNGYGDLMILDEHAIPTVQLDKIGLRLWDITAIGYYYNGTFYSDADHTTAITPTAGKCYYDLVTRTIYIYTNGAYSTVSGEQGLVAELINSGVNVYKGMIKGADIIGGTINIARGNDVGLYCDGTTFQFGDFEVNTDYGRQILESTDERTGMGGEPDSSGGLYLWAGYNSGNDYRLAVNDAGLYTMYDGTAYNVGQTLAYILENCCSGGCPSDGCDCEGNNPGCPGDGCLCYGTSDDIGDGCCMCDAVTDDGGGSCTCDTGESCPSCDSGESCTCNTGESCSCDTAQCGPGDGL